MQLFLNTYGTFLQKKDGMFQVKIDEVKKVISPKKISSIVISNSATISTDAIQLALDNNIDIVFLDNFGNPIGRVWFPRLGSTTFIRRRLLEIDMKDEGLPIIKEWILTKAQNQLDFIKKLLSKRDRDEEEFAKLLESMEVTIGKIKAVNAPLSVSDNTIMAYEGNISKQYFKALSLLIPDKFTFSGRSTRPALDPFNAVLNYSYGVLYSKIEKALLIAGLDPFIGLLHKDNYNKKSLVFDFIEPYRIFCDEPVFYLFSRHKLPIEGFVDSGKGILLNDECKKTIILEITNFFDDTIRYRNKNTKRVDTILADAHAFANWLIGKREDY
ncbi:MAG: CRISPR-associated endonuclease Cas1 [Candidatus Cloacimonadales bacterium]